MKSFLWQRKNWFTALSLLFLLALSLAACGNNGSGNESSKPTSTARAATSTPSSTPTVKMGTQPCPDAVKDPAHWDPIIPTHRPDSRVKSVSCGYLMGTPTLQALITVDKGGSGAMLDVYVYNNITDANPTRLFKLQDLIHGDAKISGYNTALTKEVDQNSSINKGQPGAALMPDLFREFQWSDGAGTLVQTVFPGLYPDLTRYQAEADQEEVNKGKDPWKLDALETTRHALKFLNRPATNPLTLLSGGGPRDLTAAVRAESFPQGGGVTTTIITLSRLEGNANGGIWEITAVQAKDFGITSSPSGLSTLITSPVTVKGFGGQFEGEVGNVVILDHLYTEIGREIARGTGGFTASSFAVDVPYTSSFQGGAQEGIVVLYQNSGGGIPAVAMVKVLYQLAF